MQVTYRSQKWEKLERESVGDTGDKILQKKNKKKTSLTRGEGKTIPANLFKVLSKYKNSSFKMIVLCLRTQIKKTVIVSHYQTHVVARQQKNITEF